MGWQGIAALIAMNVLEQEPNLAKDGWGSANHLHASIEAIRLGFSDALAYVADPEVMLKVSAPPAVVTIVPCPACGLWGCKVQSSGVWLRVSKNADYFPFCKYSRIWAEENSVTFQPKV